MFSRVVFEFFEEPFRPSRTGNPSHRNAASERWSQETPIADGKNKCTSIFHNSSTEI